MAAQADAKTVLVAVANGSEELETVAIVDVLRRAGVQVTVASVEPELQVVCSRGVKLVADKLISEAGETTFDAVACPGGMPGAERLANNEVLSKLLTRHAEQGKLVSAICAAPAVVLEPLGLLSGKPATCHPAFADKLGSAKDGCSEARVEVSDDGRVVTSRGPGTAIEFALKLVELLCGAERQQSVAAPMVLRSNVG